MKQFAMELKVLWDTQRRRMVSLGVLMVAFALMLGRNVILPGIKGALASPEPKAAAASAAPEAASEAVHVSARPMIRLPAPPPLARDLFAYDRDRFPLPAPEPEVAQNLPKSGDVPVEVTPGEVEPTLAQIEAGIRSEAGTLRLRSLVVGAAPLAVIEVEEGEGRGRHLLSEGDSVAGFRLVSVKETSVILVKQDVEVELFMAPAE